MDKRIIFSALSGIYALVLLIGSLVVKPNSVLPSSDLDYYAHIIGFFIFAVIFFFTLKIYKVKNKFMISLAVSLALSLIVELLRIPGRGFSPVDLGFNVLGAIIGLVLIWIFSNL